jgi:hypothetical protein
MKQTLEEMQLVGAFVTRPCGNSALRIYDDSFGEFFVVGDEYGPTHVIRAHSVHSALDIWADEQPSIPVEDVPEAYGFDSEDELRAFEERGEYPELADGYAYQENHDGGSGIVNVGYYQWIVPLDAANRERLGVTIQVADYV